MKNTLTLHILVLILAVESCSSRGCGTGSTDEREYLLSTGCYELTNRSSGDQELLKGLVSKLLFLEPFSPDISSDQPFYEISDISSLPLLDSAILSDKPALLTGDYRSKLASYRLIQQIKIRENGIWYANDNLMNLAAGPDISTWTDPVTNQTILDPCFFTPSTLQWKSCHEEKLEKLILSLMDGRVLESYTPLRWSISFEYCLIPCLVDYPSFHLDVDRIAAVSSLLVVRNFRMHVNSFDVYNLSPSGTGTINLSLSIPETEIHLEDGYYLLGKTYSFIPTK